MTDPKSRILPVILSGGSGTRLWPVSRQHRPKQFLNLVTQEPLLIDTVRRVADPERYLPPVFIANEEHRFMIAEAMRTAALASGSIILEPSRRNTAAPVAVAAVWAARLDPDQILLVMPSDHVISDLSALNQSLEAGIDAARTGHLVVFGITPTSAHTGYGYIKLSEQQAGSEHAYGVSEFQEKPDAETAQAYLADGSWLWNSGMFLFRAGEVIAEFEKFAPDALTAARVALDTASEDLDFVRLGTAGWATAPSIPFDKAVLEKTHKCAVVPTEMGWSDIGTWSSLAGITEPGPNGNVTSANVVEIDVKNSLVQSDGPLIGALGLDNLIVIATTDAVLVASKDREDDVRTLVEKIESHGHAEHAGSSITYRPWGRYEDVDQGKGFKVKRLVVNPGQALSRQSHNHRAEHWVVVEGIADVLRGDEELQIEANQSVYIPCGTVHRLANTQTETLQVVEVQTGAYLEEDDIVRYDDVYGRS